MRLIHRLKHMVFKSIFCCVCFASLFQNVLSMHPKNTLQLLPNELIILIIESGGAQVFCSLRETSRKFKNIADKFPCIFYKMYNSCISEYMYFNLPLMRAVDRKEVCAVSFLLKSCLCDPNESDRDGFTPLHNAIRTEQIKIIELLLGHHMIDVNKRSYSAGWSPLLRASCMRNNEKVLKLLLEHEKIQVNLVDTFGMTPLHWAVFLSRDNVVKLLLGHKNININAVTYGGKTPLGMANKSGADNIIMLLKKAGAKN